MEIEGFREFDLEFEADDLIDNDRFPETVEAKNVVSLDTDVNDHLPELHESTEPERNQRNGRYNLRKSLAWDSAFFTNAGVLDAEELSSMIIGSDKKKKHILPGIQEELTCSTESISTLQSESLTLETLDDDLFLDIRASIQRSSKKASNFSYSSPKIAMESDGSAISCPEKENFVSQNTNPKSGVKITSGVPTAPKSQLKPNGKLPSGRPIKKDSVQSQTGSICKTGEMKSALPNSVSTSATAKQDSVGSSRQGAVSGKGTQLPKVSALSGSKKVLPKSVVPLKSSSTISSVHLTRSSTSSDSSTNTSSRHAAKPTLLAARRNIVKNNNISMAPSNAIPKTSSRAVAKNKLPVPTLSSYLKSTKISPTVSPASSISEWSSASSTTSSVVKQRSNNLRTSLDTSSCTSVDGDNVRLDPRNYVAGQKANKQGNRGLISAINTSKKSSMESASLRAPAKPSGLRLPSPKIGFFDGSSSRTPNGQQRAQSVLSPVFPKNEAATSTPARSSIGKLKSAKVPTARMATSLANIKPGSPKAPSPASSQEKSHASASSDETSHAMIEASNVSADVNDSSGLLSVGVKGSETGESCQRPVEVEAEKSVKQVETTAGEGNDSSGSEYISQTLTSSQSSKGKLKSAKVPTTRVATCLTNLKSVSPKAACQEKSDVSCRSCVGVSGQNRVEVEGENGVKQVVDADRVGVDKDDSNGSLAAYRPRPPFAIKNLSCSGECSVIQIAGSVAVDLRSNKNTDTEIGEAVEKENHPAFCQPLTDTSQTAILYPGNDCFYTENTGYTTCMNSS